MRTSKWTVMHWLSRRNSRPMRKSPFCWPAWTQSWPPQSSSSLNPRWSALPTPCGRLALCRARSVTRRSPNACTVFTNWDSLCRATTTWPASCPGRGRKEGHIAPVRERGVEAELVRRIAAACTRADSQRPSSSVRSTCVFTKKPINPSVSTRLRLAFGTPTRMSRCPE